MPIKIVVADDHEVARTGIVSLFRGSDIEVVGQAENGNQAVELANALAPQALLLDVRMLECDGLTALEQLRERLPRLPVIVLSSHDNPTYIARAVALGARDYVLKGTDRSHLIDAVHRAVMGEPIPIDSVMYPIREKMRQLQKPDSNEIPLSKRELQVLRHLAFGLSNREIARSLSISVETAKEHVQKVIRKLDVSDRTAAAVWAVKRSLA